MPELFISITKEELETIVTNAVQTVMDRNIPTLPEPEPEEKYFTTPALLEYLSIKKSTLYQLTHRKAIPFFKKGRTMYFKKEDIDQWVLEGKQLTKEEERRRRDFKLGLLQKRKPGAVAGVLTK